MFVMLDGTEIDCIKRLSTNEVSGQRGVNLRGASPELTIWLSPQQARELAHVCETLFTDDLPEDLADRSALLACDPPANDGKPCSCSCGSECPSETAPKNSGAV